MCMRVCRPIYSERCTTLGPTPQLGPVRFLPGSRLGGQGAAHTCIRVGLWAAAPDWDPEMQSVFTGSDLHRDKPQWRHHTCFPVTSGDTEATESPNSTECSRKRRGVRDSGLGCHPCTWPWAQPATHLCGYFPCVSGGCVECPPLGPGLQSQHLALKP